MDPAKSTGHGIRFDGERISLLFHAHGIIIKRVRKGRSSFFTLTEAEACEFAELWHDSLEVRDPAESTGQAGGEA